MRISGRTATTIAASLETNLQGGKRAAGESLPTVRDLAAALNVSPATVAAAYRLLRARGLVAGDRRRGTRVSRVPVVAAPLTASELLPPGTVDLATGNPDPDLLPDVASALHAIEDHVHLYGDGTDRTGLVRFASAEFDADGIPAESVAVLSGAMDGVERVLREHLRAGDRVALEDPSFPGLIDLLSASGYVPVPYATDDEGPLSDALRDALGTGCRAVVVTPRAQNPTGAAVTAGRTADLKRVLRGYPEVVLIENDYASPIAGAAFASLRPNAHKSWVVIRSTSKFLGPDLRVAVMAGDVLTISRVRGRQALGPRWVSHILQQLTLALWADPSSGRRLARAREIYAQRRMAAVAALREKGVIARGVSGFNIWIPVREETTVVRALAERGWAVAAGERFRIRSSPGIRVTTSTLLPEEAVRFADDVAAALDARHAAFA